MQTSSFLGRGATALRAQWLSSTSSLSKRHHACNKAELCRRLAADGQSSALLHPPHRRRGSFFLPAASSLRSRESCLEDHSKESHGSYHPSQRILQAKGVFLFLQWTARLRNTGATLGINGVWAPVSGLAQHSCGCERCCSSRTFPMFYAKSFPVPALLETGDRPLSRATRQERKISFSLQ